MRRCIQMRLEKETPGTFLFKAVGIERVIDALYVRKTALGGLRPEVITVTVEAVDPQ